MFDDARAAEPAEGNCRGGQCTPVLVIERMVDEEKDDLLRGIQPLAIVVLLLPFPSFFYPTFPRFFVLCAFICIIKDMTRLC